MIGHTIVALQLSNRTQEAQLLRRKKPESQKSVRMKIYSRLRTAASVVFMFGAVYNTSLKLDVRLTAPWTLTTRVAGQRLPELCIVCCVQDTVSGDTLLILIRRSQK